MVCRVLVVVRCAMRVVCCLCVNWLMCVWRCLRFGALLVAGVVSCLLLVVWYWRLPVRFAVVCCR